ncbi:hypothetical protein CFC21_030217, partial [Triticum aestivum]
YMTYNASGRVPRRRGPRTAAHAQGVRAAAAPALQAAIPGEVRRAEAAPGEPLVNPGRHDRELVPVHVQELHLPRGARAQQGRVVRLQGLLRPGGQGAAAVADRQRRPWVQHRRRAAVQAAGHRAHRPGHRRRDRHLRGADARAQRDRGDHDSGPGRALQPVRRVARAGAAAHQPRAALPFADGVLDIVHSMHVLTNSVPAAVLEFAFFDIYRVLRPGGVFWLDHFFCLGPQLNSTYVPILDRVGFRRLRWKASRKLDLGAERNEWYVSALLEKPMT